MFNNQLHFIFFIITFFWIGCTINNGSEEIDFDNKLASINISTFGNPIQDDPKIDAHLLISVDDNVQFEGNIAIEIRGSSSQRFPKKSYSFETRNENNEDLDVSLLGLPKEEDWILHGPYTDKTLIRNKFMYDLSINIGNYASRTVFVELAINDEHQGLYILMEKLKRGKNRIDITKLSNEDITGGYILKIDRAVENAPEASFISSFPPPFSTRNQQITFVFEEPSSDEITITQKNYITEYLANFETALDSEDFINPTSGYSAYINMASFIDYFLMNELANNVDAFRLSTFISKDKNEKLNMGPVWDFNYALGNVDFCDAGETDVWAHTFNERCGHHNQQVPFWWSRFLEDPTYVSQLKQRWNELRINAFSESIFNEMIDAYSEFLKQHGGINKNFEVWDILGVDVHPNNFVGNTHEEEIEYLKSWLKDRLTWLDSTIEGLN